MGNKVYKSNKQSWVAEKQKRQDVEEALTMMQSLDTEIRFLKSTINKNKYGEVRRFNYDSVEQELKKRKEENENMIRYTSYIHTWVENVEHAFYNKINKKYEELSIIDLNGIEIPNNLGLTKTVSELDYPTGKYKQVEKSLKTMNITDIMLSTDIINLQEQYEQYKFLTTFGKPFDARENISYEDYVKLMNTTKFDHERYCHSLVKGFSNLVDYIPIFGSLKNFIEALRGASFTGELMSDSEKWKAGTIAAIFLAIQLVGPAGYIGSNTKTLGIKTVTKDIASKYLLNLKVSMSLSGGTYVLNKAGADPVLVLLYNMIGSGIAYEYFSKGTSGIKTVEVNGKTVTLDDSTFDPNYIDPKSGLTNVQRMEQGLAPIGIDGKPVNMHHIDQTNTGPVMEITATEHQANYKELHVNIGQSPSLIDRNEFNQWRRSYWQWRTDNIK